MNTVKLFWFYKKIQKEKSIDRIVAKSNFKVNNVKERGKVRVVVNCAGKRKVSEPLYQELLENGFEVYRVGENGASNFQNATREALQLAYSM